MFKKVLSIALVVVMLTTMCFAFASCKKDNADFKLGVILLHDEFSTYDLNFINGIKDAAKELGLSEDQVVFKKNIPESNECYEAACDLVDEGCDVIFADSFGHETFMIKAAEEFKDIEFCHATGNQAHVKNLPNYHNAFASIYEGRYLAGVAAGMKLNEMIEAGKITADQAVMGYVGAFTYAEVISGYTSFYLGAKSVCPSVTMKVQFTGSWYDENLEKNTALALIDKGCVLISQHADSMGAPTVCEEKKVPNVSYNGSTLEDCPGTFIVSSRINWAPYIKYICEQNMAGKTIDTDWTGTIATDSVVLTDINTQVAAAGTVEKVAEVKAKLQAGTLHVFDTATAGFITVGGAAITSHKVEDKEVVSDGYFHESDLMSAPYFDLRIDGIELLNEDYGD